MTAQNIDTLASLLRVIARDLELKNPPRALAVYEASTQLKQLAVQNHKLRQACAKALCANDEGWLNLREARDLYAEALREVAE